MHWPSSEYRAEAHPLLVMELDVRGQRVLDLGCGTWALTGSIVAATGAKWRGDLQRDISISWPAQ
jgi:predicted RNA methylase